MALKRAYPIESPSSFLNFFDILPSLALSATCFPGSYIISNYDKEVHTDRTTLSYLTVKKSTSKKGLKISSFASLSSEGDTEKSDAGSETGLKIASVSGNSPLKIANVMSNATSGKDDDIVSLDDSASKKTPNQQKKPVLKLASFAG